MRTIFDPVYGSVPISDVELEIISAPAFQRLQNVKQLGLAHLIFPGANYSRFSHSIGALRNARRFIEAIKENAKLDGLNFEISPSDEQRYRLAALLHDIGHFPFSHATEVAFDEYRQEEKIQSGREIEIVDNHEDFGSLIINHDPAINEILARHDFIPNDISSVFASDNYVGGRELNLKAIISSELDCDRLDYLKRTSHFSGLPFGNVDIDYLIRSAHIHEGKLCFDKKAIKSIDHMLLARFHDYQQVVYHKTLIALEWSLKEAIKHCIKVNDNGIEIEKSVLIRKIESGEIKGFDDFKFTEAFKQAHSHCSVNKETSALLHLDAILHRKPAKQVFYSQEYMDPTNKSHEELMSRVEEVLENYCSENSLDRSNFHVWGKKHNISKVNPTELCEARSVSDIAVTEELIHIYNCSADGDKVIPLVFAKNSLISVLARKFLSDIRVFILPFKGYEEHRRNLTSILFSQSSSPQ